jgi:hypothetical protein
MRQRIVLLLIFGFLLFAFSHAEASITWTGDNFTYSVTDSGGVYFPGMAPLSTSESFSTSAGSSENATAVAVESDPGLAMTSAAWGNASQNASADTGGATVESYADNTLALDNPIGVLGAGQNVISYIDRGFTVSSTGPYTITASGLGSVFSNLTSGSIYAVPTQLTGQVQIFQTDATSNTTTLLDSQTFSISNLMSSPQIAALNLVSGDFYQMVVAISGVTSLGGQNSPPGIVTSYSNYSQSGFSGNLDGSLGAGTPSNPITLTATLFPGGIISTLAGT